MLGAGGGREDGDLGDGTYRAWRYVGSGEADGKILPEVSVLLWPGCGAGRCEPWTWDQLGEMARPVSDIPQAIGVGAQRED